MSKHKNPNSVGALRKAMKQTKGRECGSCTFCCGPVYSISEQKVPFTIDRKTHKAIPTDEPVSFSKSQGATCQFCEVDGCGIYEHRPQVCRDYTCLWLEGWGHDWLDRPETIRAAGHFRVVEEPGVGTIKVLSFHITEQSIPKRLITWAGFLNANGYVVHIARPNAQQPGSNQNELMILAAGPIGSMLEARGWPLMEWFTEEQIPGSNSGGLVLP